MGDNSDGDSDYDNINDEDKNPKQEVSVTQPNPPEVKKAEKKPVPKIISQKKKK